MSTYKKIFVARSASSVYKPDLNDGGRVLLPYTVLEEVSRLRMVYPLQFKITFGSHTTYAAVLEFSANLGEVVMPDWMFEHLKLKESSLVSVMTCSLDAGSLVKLRPHKTEFVTLIDPRHVLEYRMVNYPVLPRGATILVCYAGNEYKIDVVDILNMQGKSVEAVLTVRADAQATELKVEFERPLDQPPSPRETDADTHTACSPVNENVISAKAGVVQISSYQYKPPTITPISSPVKENKPEDANEQKSVEPFAAFVGAGQRLSTESAVDKPRLSMDEIRARRLQAMQKRSV